MIISGRVADFNPSNEEMYDIWADDMELYGFLLYRWTKIGDHKWIMEEVRLPLNWVWT
jgi:hypothetical protein